MKIFDVVIPRSSRFGVETKISVSFSPEMEEFIALCIEEALDNKDWPSDNKPLNYMLQLLKRKGE